MKAIASCLLVLVALVSGCGRPFDIKTPSTMVELDSQEPAYAFRAMTPEGVVVAVRTVDPGKADLGFWTRAVNLRIKELAAYAVLGMRDVSSRDGTKGTEVRFGHDENGKPYLYTVRLFLAGGRLYVVEAGGSKAEMDRYKATVDWTLDSLRFK
jgi:hypothetical protein